MSQPFRGRPARSFALAVAAACLGCACGAPASAAIFRCGNSYSDRPCDGAARIEAPEAPSAEQRRQADEGTRKDEAAAERMQRERLRLEASAAHRGAVILGPAPKPTSSVKAASASVLDGTNASKGTKAKKPNSGKARG